MDQAILLWNLIHMQIRRFRDERPTWTFLRHEDLSREPVTGFRALYERFGYAWTPEVQRTIEDHSGVGNPEETTDAASHRRDSAKAITAWKARLSPEEIDGSARAPPTSPRRSTPMTTGSGANPFTLRSVRRRLLRDRPGSSGRKVATLIVGIGVQAMLAHLLTQSQFGIYTTAFTMALLGAAMAQLGLDRAVVRFVAGAIGLGRAGAGAHRDADGAPVRHGRPRSQPA